MACFWSMGSRSFKVIENCEVLVENGDFFHTLPPGKHANNYALFFHKWNEIAGLWGDVNRLLVLHCHCAYRFWDIVRLRSADHGDLIVPRVQTQRYGSCSFRVSGPTVWNSLPQNLRSSDISREQFKRGLQTWLFERAYVQVARLRIFFIEDAPYKFTFWFDWLIDWLCKKNPPFIPKSQPWLDTHHTLYTVQPSSSRQLRILRCTSSSSEFPWARVETVRCVN